MALRLSHHLCTSCCVLILMNVQPKPNPGKHKVKSSLNASVFVKQQRGNTHPSTVLLALHLGQGSKGC